MTDNEILEIKQNYTYLKAEIARKFNHLESFCKNQPSFSNDEIEDVYLPILDLLKTGDLELNFKLLDETFIIKAFINPSMDNKYVIFHTYHIFNKANILEKESIRIPIQLKMDDHGNLKFIGQNTPINNLGKVYISTVLKYILMEYNTSN